jgi:transposase
LRAIVAELAERGIVVSYFAVWHFFEHEDISFKKKPARQRTGSPRRGAPPRALEDVPGPA